jgi:ATP-binding cassette subfamily B protein/subfamily B ATP-binding cassette protein MsbA
VNLIIWSLAQMKPYERRVLLLAALACLEVGLRVLLPWPMKAVIDIALGPQAAPAWLAMFPGVRTNSRESLLVAVVVLGLFVQIAHQAVLMLHTRLYSDTGHRITRDLRQRLFMHLQAMNLRHHALTPVGESVYHLEADAGCLERLLLQGVLPFTFSALTLMVMFGILLEIDASLAVVSLSVVPFMFVWIRWSARRIRPGAERTRVLESRMTARLHESFAAIRLVKSFAREPYEGSRFSGAANEAMRARVVLSTREAIFSSVVGTLTVMGTSAVVLVGGLLVLRGRITAGTVLVALAYLGFVYGPLSGLANTVGSIQQALAGVRRVRDTLGRVREAIDERGGVEPGRLAGHVEFDHVSFAYDDDLVLHDISFVAEPGEVVALVGPSGSGKTTAVSLIPRFYEPTSGRVLIDGVDVSTYKLRPLREQIALVLQEAVMLSGTVRDNLRYGRLHASGAAVEAAARAANAHDFITRLPRGYDTELGEAGSGLSGGQKQRLSMARAFLKDAPILILDEPTAALDNVAERLVLAALERLRLGRTTLVIAHRLTTVRHANRILVLDRGRIVAQGTHDTLLRDSALYRALAAQLTGTSEE